MCVYFCYVHMYVGACGGQKRVPDPLELELQRVVTCLVGVPILNSGPLKGKQSFNCRAISPASLLFSLSLCKVFIIHQIYSPNVQYRPFLCPSSFLLFVPLTPSQLHLSLYAMYSMI